MIIAAIPARSGSKGIPNKNIVDLGGKPLLVWSIEVAKEVPEIYDVIVSTDSIDYALEVVERKACYVLRPPEFSQDNSPDYDWVKHLLQIISINPDLIVHLRPTTPLRDPKLISEAIKRFQDTPEATSLRSVQEMGESAYKCFIKPREYLLTIIPGIHPNDPRQMYTKTYHPNGYVDILRVSHILEHGELYGDKILAFETPRVTEIDTLEDLEFVRWQIKKEEK